MDGLSEAPSEVRQTENTLHGKKPPPGGFFLLSHVHGKEQPPVW